MLSTSTLQAGKCYLCWVPNDSKKVRPGTASDQQSLWDEESSEALREQAVDEHGYGGDQRSPEAGTQEFAGVGPHSTEPSRGTLSRDETAESAVTHTPQDNPPAENPPPGGSGPDGESGQDGRVSLRPTRQFLGWRAPLIQTATEWLFDELAGDGLDFGFSSVLIVVPGRRSGRLLVEQLTRAARQRGHAAFLLPEILTPGALPERFLAPGEDVLGGTNARILLAHALREIADHEQRRSTMEEALGELPTADDWMAWLETAQRIETIRRDLGTLGIGIGAVPSRLQQHLEALPEEATRWKALVAVDRWLVGALKDVGVATRSTARLAALREGRLLGRGELPRRVVLMGLADFPVLFRRVLELSYGDDEPEPTGAGVDALIHAPDLEAERFDVWGCPRRESWSTLSGPLAKAMRDVGETEISKHFVERPADQVGVALQTVEEWSTSSIGDKVCGQVGQHPEIGSGEHGSPRTMTIGVGDEASAFRLLEGLRSRGISAHSPFGVRLLHTEPLLALRRLTRYQRDGRLESLNELLQVPLVYRWVASVMGALLERSRVKNSDEGCATSDDESLGEVLPGDPELNLFSSTSTGRPIDFGVLKDRDLCCAWRSRDWLSFVERVAVLRLGAVPRSSSRDSMDGDVVLRILHTAVDCLLRAGEQDEQLDDPVRTIQARCLAVEAQGQILRASTGVLHLASAAERLALALRRLYSFGDQDVGRDAGHSSGPGMDDRLGERDLETDSPGLATEENEQALLLVGEILRDARFLTVPPLVTLEEACSALFFDRSQSLSGMDQQGTVEVVGWLEMALDDADSAVVTDLNEGLIPAKAASDPLLPESTRSLLGLGDDARRCARDCFLLTALLKSRNRVTLLSCRRTEQGEPLLPSRLMLTGQGVELARHVKTAFGHTVEEHEKRREHGEVSESPSSLWLGSTGATSVRMSDAPSELKPLVDSFVPSEPNSEALLQSPTFQERITRLRVTDFRAYKSCPYRFFLRRILRATPAPEWSTELDGGRFGTLVHEVLRRFGACEEALVEDPQGIEDVLFTLTDRCVVETIGEHLPVPAIIQIEHLKRRLRRFAVWQARSNQDGWQIQRNLAEAPLSLTLVVDEEPVEIVGRIDRVDRHEVHGYRLLDYKTSDTPAEPKAALGTQLVDGVRGPVWLDLQLPLYRAMALDREDLFDANHALELGYLRLSKKLRAPVYRAGAWDADDYRLAMANAHDVIRSLRQAKFWPPAVPPRYDDGLQWAAGDTLPALRGATSG